MNKIALAAVAGSVAAFGAYIAAQVAVMLTIVNGEGIEEVEL